METDTAIDFLILANHVEALNGLLYISGGGWTDHYRVSGSEDKSPTTKLAIGISVLVPWLQTNQPHKLVIRVENQDSTLVLGQIEAELNVGRPPTLPPGSDQHVGVALDFHVRFPTSGEYRVIADLNDGRDAKRWPFRIHDTRPHLAS